MKLLQTNVWKVVPSIRKFAPPMATNVFRLYSTATQSVLPDVTIAPLSVERIHADIRSYPEINKTTEFEKTMSMMNEQQLQAEYQWITSELQQIICCVVPLSRRFALIYLYDHFKLVRDLYYRKTNKTLYLKPIELRFIFYAQLKRSHIYRFLNEFYKECKDYPVAKSWFFTISEYLKIFQKFAANKLEVDTIAFFKNENLRALSIKEKNFSLYFSLLLTCRKYNLPSEDIQKELQQAIGVLDWSSLEGWFCQLASVYQFYETHPRARTYEANEVSNLKRELLLKLRTFFEFKVVNEEQMERFLQIGSMHLSSRWLYVVIERIHMVQFCTYDFVSVLRKAAIFLEVTSKPSFQSFEYSLETYGIFLERNLRTFSKGETEYQQYLFQLCIVLFSTRFPEFRKPTEELLYALLHRLHLKREEYTFVTNFTPNFPTKVVHYYFIKHLIISRRVYMLEHYLELYGTEEMEFQAEMDEFVPYKVPILRILRAYFFSDSRTIDFLTTLVEKKRIPTGPHYYLLQLMLKYEKMDDKDIVDTVNQFSKRFHSTPDRCMIIENLLFLLSEKGSYETVDKVMLSVMKHGTLPITRLMHRLHQNAKLRIVDPNAEVLRFKRTDLYLLDVLAETGFAQQEVKPKEPKPIPMDWDDMQNIY